MDENKIDIRGRFLKFRPEVYTQNIRLIEQIEELRLAALENALRDPDMLCHLELRLSYNINKLLGAN